MTTYTIEQAFIKAIPLIAIDLQNALRLASPVDKGALRNSIKVRAKNNNKLEITMVEYGKFVEFGTLPYTIKPSNKKALNWKGAQHPVKKVNHPGIRPNPFIRTTLQRKLPKIISKRIAEALA